MQGTSCHQTRYRPIDSICDDHAATILSRHAAPRPGIVPNFSSNLDEASIAAENNIHLSTGCICLYSCNPWRLRPFDLGVWGFALASEAGHPVSRLSAPHCLFIISYILVTHQPLGLFTFCQLMCMLYPRLNGMKGSHFQCLLSLQNIICPKLWRGHAK